MGPGLRGLVAILFGILAFAWPGLTLAFLVFLYGAYALVDGVLDLVAFVRTSHDHRWGLLLAASLKPLIDSVTCW